MKTLIRTQKASAFLILAVLLAPVASTEADVVLRKRVFAHFPDKSWCPFEDAYDFSFIATTDKAELMLQAMPEELGGAEVEVDNIRVVEERVFTWGFRGWAGLDPETEGGCWNQRAPYFDPSEAGITDILFEEGFDDASGWALVNAQISDGFLTLGVDPTLRTSARATMTGLTPGTRYFVTGWSSWVFNGEVTVKVDTPRPSALTLQDGRFQLELRHDSAQFAGGAVVSEQSAVFWFRDQSKTELIVNVIDRCLDKGKYYVEVGGTTTTKASIVITDLQSGKKLSYQNKKGERFQPKLDQQTFSCQ